MDIFRAQANVSVVGQGGKMYRRRRTAGSMPQQEQFAIPAGFVHTNTPGTWVQLKSRLYGAGTGSDNAMIDEHYRFSRLGLQAPSQVPTLTTGAGPGPTANCQVAIAFYDRAVDEWSPLSGFSDVVAIANQARVTANIQATSNDYRVTDVGLFVVADGSTPRLATTRQLGITTITENIATLALGAARPTPFNRMARCVGFAGYHDRLVGFGDVLNPDIVYVSAIGFPERYEGLSFRTRNGEAITAAIAVRDVCLILTANSAYVLRGYKDADMTLTLTEAEVGSINNSSWRIMPGGNAVIVNHQGFWVYNGAFHNITLDRTQAWLDFYEHNREAVETSVGAIDPLRNTYTLWVKGPTGGLTLPEEIWNPDSRTIRGFGWTFDYAGISPQLEGNLTQPNWFVDIMTRPITAAGLLSVPGTKRYDLYLGSIDGYVRGLDPTDASDDSDTYGKRMFIRTGAYAMSDPGGDSQSGKKYVSGYTYMESEISAWTVYWKGGDEDAWRTITPDNTVTFWREEIAASLLVEIVPTLVGHIVNTYAAKSVHPHVPEQVTGRCLTLEVDIETPREVHWRGFGGRHGPGPATRPRISSVPTK